MDLSALDKNIKSRGFTADEQALGAKGDSIRLNM